MMSQAKCLWPLICLLCLSFGVLTNANAKAKPTLHTVFTAECDTYFNWQSIGLYHSFKQSGQPGKLTRLLSCTDQQRRIYQDIDVGVPTHFAPSWSKHPVTGDIYSGINKPVALRDWIQKVKPSEDIILIIDDDTIMRRVLDPVALGVKPGWAVAGFYGYMKGVNNEMALKHVPMVSPRNDSFAGPFGRRGDQVGGFSLMYKDDLARMMDDWVSITEDVRADPDAWNTSGDAFTPHFGIKPWIAEMYGYSFGASKNNIWHHTNDRIMLYPGYKPYQISEDLPIVLHYGLKFSVNHTKGTWEFDKHWYPRFDPLQCPLEIERDKNGRPMSMLFDHPPHPSELVSKGIERFRDLLSLEAMSTLNEALCLRHLDHCEPSKTLLDTCKKVFEISKAVIKAQEEMVEAHKLGKDCQDELRDCRGWAEIGECVKNEKFMAIKCPLSCRACKLPQLKLNEAYTEKSNITEKINHQEGLHEVVKNRGEYELARSLGFEDRKAIEEIIIPEKKGVATNSGQNPDENEAQKNDSSPDKKLLDETATNLDTEKSPNMILSGENVDDKFGKDKLEDAESVRNRLKSLDNFDTKNKKGEILENPKYFEEKSVKTTVNDEMKVENSGKSLDVRNPDEKSQYKERTPVEHNSEKSKSNLVESTTPKALEIQKQTPGTKKLNSEDIAKEKKKLERILDNAPCKDKNPSCPNWASIGECRKNEAWMLINCRKSCKVCHKFSEPITQEEMTRVQKTQDEARARLAQLKRLENLKELCYRAAHYSMQDVHACLKKAENGGEYQRAPHSNRRPAFRKNGILLNTKRGSIVAPNSSKPSDQIKRRLGENLRYREKEEWDFNWLDFIFMGVVAIIVYGIARSCIPFLRPSNTARQKGIRQD